MDFFEVIGADANFILTSDKQGEWKTSRFNINLIDKYDRISLGASLSPVMYSIDTALYTKIIAVLDVDTKDISDLEVFLSHAPPTVKLETNKGYHFLWCSETPLKIRTEDGLVSDDYDTFLILNIFTKNLTRVLKSKFPNADKFFNINYTRMPRKNKLFEFTGKFYTPLDFMVAMNDLFKIKKLEQPSIEDFNFISKPAAKSFYTLSQLISTEETCLTLNNLIKNPEKHSYDDWHSFTRHFANKLVLATDENEAKAVRLQFHNLSSKYHGYNYQQNEKFLTNLADYGFVPLSCQWLAKLPLTRCSDCPFKQTPTGTVYSITETVSIPPNLRSDVAVLNGAIYHIHQDDNETRLFYMSKDFSILDVVEIGQADGISKFSKLLVDGDERILLFDKNNKPENLGVLLDSNPKYNKKLVEIFMFNYLLKSPVKKTLPEVIDYFETGFFNVDKFTRFKIRSQNLYPETLYEEQGEFSVWREAYREAFELDEVIRIATGLYLTQFFLSKDMKYVLPLNPILMIVGITGAGKTLRTSIVNSLFYFPDVRLSKEGAYSTSVPYLASIQAKVRLPFNIDEVRVLTTQDEEIFKELIYYISNGTPRNNLKGRQYPLKSPAIITGELKNTTFIHRSEVDGLNRRLMIITLSAIDIQKVQRLAIIVQKLYRHYGFAGRFFESFVFDEDKFNYVRQELKQKYPTVFPTILNNLAAIYVMSNAFASFLSLSYTLDKYMSDIEAIRFELNQDPVFNFLDEVSGDSVVSPVLSVLTDIFDLMKKTKNKTPGKAKVEFSKRQFNAFLQQVKRQPNYNLIEKIINILVFKPVSAGNIRFVSDTTNIFYLLSEENDLDMLTVYFNRLKSDVLNSLHSYITKNIYTFDEIVELLPYLRSVLIRYLEEKSPSSSVSQATAVVNQAVFLQDPEVLKVEISNLNSKLGVKQTKKVAEDLV